MVATVPMRTVSMEWPGGKNAEGSIAVAVTVTSNQQSQRIHNHRRQIKSVDVKQSLFEGKSEE
jgi:S-adenosylmethionine synthetase